MAVPIENIYYLLCYAWDRLDARGMVDAGAIRGDRVENLLAQVLCTGVSRLLRAGLDRGYVPVEQDARVLRGKLLMSETVKRTLLPRGRVACAYDELTIDVPHNRVIKAAIQSLLRVETVEHKLRLALRGHLARLSGVSDVPLDGAAFRAIQLHSNLARYAFLMQVCRLIAQCFMPDETTGQQEFHPFTGSEQQMGLLFEAFVRNFCRRELPEVQVSAPQIKWNATAEREEDLAWLPVMRTDMVLAGARRVVLEAKCYGKPFTEHHGVKKLISAHLYQLHTYLTHLEPGDQGGATKVGGALLYAATGAPVRLHYTLGQHRVEVRSLDLAQPWPAIHEELSFAILELVGAD